MDDGSLAVWQEGKLFYRFSLASHIRERTKRHKKKRRA